MPKIFSKNCKITVIEYGSETSSGLSWKDLKSKVQELMPTASVMKFIKRAS